MRDSRFPKIFFLQTGLFSRRSRHEGIVLTSFNNCKYVTVLKLLEVTKQHQNQGYTLNLCIKKGILKKIIDVGKFR
jgi:hypothetical protein